MLARNKRESACQDCIASVVSKGISNTESNNTSPLPGLAASTATLAVPSGSAICVAA